MTPGMPRIHLMIPEPLRVTDLYHFNFTTIAFELTNRCPIRCRSCLRDCTPQKGSVMNFEQIRSVLDNLGKQASFRLDSAEENVSYMLIFFYGYLNIFIIIEGLVSLSPPMPFGRNHRKNPCEFLNRWLDTD